MKSTIKAGMVSALTGVGALVMLSPAYGAGFVELDTNSDGQLDLAELQAAFDVHAETTLEAYDVDGDGMISVEEAQAVAPGASGDSTEGAPVAAKGVGNAGEASAEGAANAAQGLEQAAEVAADAAEDGLSTATKATEGAAEAAGGASAAAGNAAN